MKITNFISALIIVTFFSTIKKCYSMIYEKYSIQNIFIEFNLNDNISNRKKAISTAYNIALERYLMWITLKSKKEILKIISSVETNKVIKGFSIENEKFTNEKYSALITVNFDKTEIIKTLNYQDIKFSFLSGPKTLIIPLLKIEDRYILWDDPNPWFDAWIRRPLDANLTEFILPIGDVEDLILLSAEDAETLTYYKIKNITDKYKAKQTIVLFLNIEKIDNDYSINLEAFDGLSQEEINLDGLKPIDNTKSLKKSLNDLTNNFSNYYDDILVEKNIKENQLSKGYLNVEINFSSLEEWIKIKNILNNNKRVSKFYISSISNSRALVFIEVLSKKAFLEEIKKLDIELVKTNNNWIISPRELSELNDKN